MTNYDGSDNEEEKEEGMLPSQFDAGGGGFGNEDMEQFFL